MIFLNVFLFLFLQCLFMFFQCIVFSYAFFGGGLHCLFNVSVQNIVFYFLMFYAKCMQVLETGSLTVLF